MHSVRLRSFSVTLFLAFVLGFLATSAYAVDVNGRIKGTVTDPSGAVVPGAAVIATNVATGVKYPTKTLSNGDYIFPQLPVGTYSITVSASGFKKFEATGITLDIDQEYVESVKLEVGNATETLEVAADAVQVNTTEIQLSNIVNSSEMVELPLIGRAFTQLETILPGVQASSDRFGTYSADGAETQQSEYLINGADTNDIALNTVVFSPNLDAIDQFNLITGPLNAEYDRNSGGIVSATIKQGSNRFHGDVFEFYRDTFLNTGNYFSYVASTNNKTVTAYHQNIFGGTLGGPIIKDKLFFFGAYQGTHQRVPGTNGGGNTNVFSTQQRTGDFSAELDSPTNPVSSSYVLGLTGPDAGNSIPGTITQLAAYNAACAPTTTTNNNTWGGCEEALGGKIPSTAFNSVSAKLLSQYVPNANNGSNNYIFQSVTATTINQYIGRLDFTPTPKNQITVLYLQQHNVAASNIPFTGASLPGFGENDTEAIRQITADYVRQVSSTLVNDFSVHFTRFNYGAVDPQNIVTPGSLGFSISPQDAAAASVPTINTGYFTLGFSTNGPQPRIDQVYQLDDSIAKVLGRHSLKFGYDGRKFSENNPFYANNSGAFTFGGTYSTGDPGLDFLLGIPASYTQGTGGLNQAHAYLNYMYAQDNWKVTNKFTFSYGLGYSIDTPLVNTQFGGEGLSCFIGGQQSQVYPSAPVGVNYPGDRGCTSSAQAYTRYSEFGPRIGFAWSPDLGWISGGPGKFSVYGGFGIYYDRTEEESSLNNLQTPPFGLSSGGALDYTGGLPGFANPYQDLNTGAVYTNKFPYTPPAKGQSPDYSIYEPLDLNTYDSRYRAPYSENFQLSIERELPSRLITRFSYIGALGRHNQSVYEGSPETAAGHAACLADTTGCGAPYGAATGSTGVTDRFYQSYFYPSHTQWGEIDPNTGIPAYPSIGVVTSSGISNYNSFQTELIKNTTHGLQFQLSYTFAHSLDNASSYENTGYGGSRGFNQFQPGLNYGNSQFDARHRFVFAPIYTTPILHGQNWYSPMNLLLSGWEVSAITTLATGFPFDIAYNGGTASSNSAWCSPSFSFYACPDEPSQVGPMTRAANIRNRPAGSYTVWFNQAALAPAPIGQFGNEARFAYHGPGINDTDMVLAKNFNMSADGTRRLQLRLTSTNVFNHTQFSNPTGSVGIGTTTGTTSYGSFGWITAAANARLTQLAAKFYF
jgi:Carboxypeptidase regulatory-like domain